MNGWSRTAKRALASAIRRVLQLPMWIIRKGIQATDKLSKGE